MIQGVVVDTSIWVDHFRIRNDRLVELLRADLVMSHPMIWGEIACGTPPARDETLLDLSLLQKTQQTTISEVIDFVEREKLFGVGCGLIDMILLVSTLITPGSQLWSSDKRLTSLASRFGVSFQATV